MTRSLTASTLAIAVLALSCGGSNNDQGGTDQSGDGGNGSGGSGSGGKMAKGAGGDMTGTGGDMTGTGGNMTGMGGDMAGMGGTGGDMTGMGGTGGDMTGMGGDMTGMGGDMTGMGGAEAPDGGSGNSAADCKAYCTCMAGSCTAQEPKKCLTTCMAATDWDLSCRTMACLDVKKNPKMKAADCQHAIGMMGMCANTGGGTGGTGGGGTGGGDDAGAGEPDMAAEKPDAANSTAECKAYCTCMAGSCAAEAPKACVTTCMAAGGWDLSCRTMACLDVKKNPKMKAADCQHAIGMMGMCADH